MRHGQPYRDGMMPHEAERLKLDRLAVYYVSIAVMISSALFDFSHTGVSLSCTAESFKAEEKFDYGG